MTRGDAEKLLGGYAAGSLTPEERQALFSAALEDQQLYEALVHEEPMRELLADPAARANLLAALDTVPKPWYYRDVHPGIIAAAVSAVVIVTVAIRFWPVRTAPPINVVAQAELPQPAKSDLPTELPFRARPSTPSKASPLPEPPRISTASPVPELPPAVNHLLEQSSARPAPLELPSFSAAIDAAKSSNRRLAFARAAVAPATLAVRYTILKKLSTGEFTPVEPGQELEASDETVIRLAPNESGFLYVMERAESGDWRPIANDRVLASMPYTVPKNGTFHAERPGPREFLVLFSRQPQNVAVQAQKPTIAPAQDQQVGQLGQLGFVTSTVTAPAPSTQVSFPITLKYK